MSQKSKTHSFYKFLTLTLLSLCLVFFGLISTSNKVKAADPNVWGKSCDQNTEAGTGIIMFHDKSDPNGGRGFKELITNKPELTGKDFGTYWCTHMEKEKRYEQTLFPVSTQAQNDSLTGDRTFTFYIPKDEGYGYVLKISFTDKNNKEAYYHFELDNLTTDALIQISIGQTLQAIDSAENITEIQVSAVTEVFLTKLDKIRNDNFFEKQNTSVSRTLAAKEDSTTNSTNAVTTPTNTSTSESTKTTATTVVILTTEKKGEEPTTIKFDDQEKNFWEIATPRIVTEVNINGAYEVILFKEGIFGKETTDYDTTKSDQGKKYTASGKIDSTDKIQFVYFNSTATATTGGATEIVNNNSDSSGPIMPGNTATYTNSNVDLSSPPILPDVRNPGNLPFIHDPELSDMEDNGRYGTIKNETGYQAFMKAIEFAIKTLIKLVGIMALFGLTEGLVRFSIAHGEEEMKEKGIKMILWSIVGLVISLISHAVVTALLQFLTGVGTINI